MPRKPTYEELEQRVRELEKEALERGHAEETLMESNEKLNSMLRSIGDHMRMIDKDQNIIWANETTRKVFGNDIIGKKCYEVCHRRKEPCKPYSCIGLMTFQDGKVHEHDTRVIGQDGEIIDFHCIANVALKDNEEKSKAVIVISRDITKRAQAEEALRHSEERLRLITDQVPAIVWTTDMDLRFTSSNGKLLESLDLASDQVVGKSLTDYFQTDDVAFSPISAHIRALDGDPVRYEFEWNGHVFDSQVEPLRDAQCQIVGTIGLALDVTERKRMEKALRESKRLLDRTFASLDQAVFVVDSSTRTIIACNPAVEHIFGYSEEQVIGQNTEFLHVDREMYEKFGRELFHALDEGGVYHSEFQIKRKDGSVFFSEHTVTEIVNDSGQRTSLVSVVSDVTKRKQAEEALRESEERFRTIFEDSPIGIDIVDKKGRPLYVNTALQQMLGYSDDEFRSMTFMDFTHPDDVEDSLKSIRPLLDGKSDLFDMEKRYYRKDGILMWAHTTVSAVRDANGEFQYFITMVEEITERKRSEEALKEKEHKLKQQARHLEEVNTALKILIQHQNEEKEKLEESILMNLKKMVLPYMEKLDKGRIEDKNKTYLSIIKSNLETLVSPFANRLSSKHLNFTPTEIQVADLVKHGQTSKEIASMLNVSPNAVMFHRKNIRKKLGLTKKKTNLRSHLQSLLI